MLIVQKVTLITGAAAGLALALLFARDGSLLCTTFAGRPGFTKGWSLPA